MVDLNKYLNQKREEREKTDPMPASPINPPILNVWFTSADGRKANLGFAALHGARKAVDFAIRDQKPHWIDDNTIKVGSVTISTDSAPDGLSQILEHDFTPRERAWELPRAYMQRIHSAFIEQAPIDDYLEQPDRPATKTPKPEKAPKPVKPTGLIDLPTLLADTDIEPKEARNALRKLGIDKPAHGRWEFPESDASTAVIKAKIIKKVKELRK